MDELHHRLIHIGLDALAEDYGYALAGGYAIQAHHIVQRISDDVDLFAPFERAKEEMPDAAARVIAAYEAAGYRVELAQQVDTCTRLNITDPDTGTFSKVELVAEFLHHPPVDSDLGPVRTRTTWPQARPAPCSAAQRSATPSTSTDCSRPATAPTG
ncbi:nucleotidyl transferase AbiEii/AbiGii toxin family protein [Actinacidiphila oryziradicis]|uniref:nucleotidyl transferase AbiEii/AbiGii toxin family protein n=1 Tax=Actinacidiphila oryziradicis TaxID=2571141 RepID=UPI001B80D661|nr:nucleotidyl transferase AbiEii/AbiGii toxin family protein [Actinacidiphila oryziradicis]